MKITTQADLVEVIAQRLSAPASPEVIVHLADRLWCRAHEHGIPQQPDWQRLLAETDLDAQARRLEGEDHADPPPPSELG